MLNKSVAKKTAALLCALFMFAYTSPASAWTWVCLDFVFWQAWFQGKFRIIRGFDQLPPEKDDRGVLAYEHLLQYRAYGKELGDPDVYQKYRKAQYNARSVSPWSHTGRAGRRECKWLRTPYGEKFVVYLRPDGALEEYGVFCYTKWRNAANREARYVYRQRYVPQYRTLVYKVTGTLFNPHCWFSHEEQ